MTAEQMWERPIQDYLNYRALTYEVFSFGNTDIMADEWVQLVKADKKTVTSSVFLRDGRSSTSTRREVKYFM